MFTSTEVRSPSSLVCSSSYSGYKGMVTQSRSYSSNSSSNLLSCIFLFLIFFKISTSPQEPIIRSEKLPYYAYVTAFLQTGLFLDTF